MPLLEELVIFGYEHYCYNESTALEEIVVGSTFVKKYFVLYVQLEIERIFNSSVFHTRHHSLLRDASSWIKHISNNAKSR